MEFHIENWAQQQQLWPLGQTNIILLMWVKNKQKPGEIMTWMVLLKCFTTNLQSHRLTEHFQINENKNFLSKIYYFRRSANRCSQLHDLSSLPRPVWPLNSSNSDLLHPKVQLLPEHHRILGRLAGLLGAVWRWVVWLVTLHGFEVLSKWLQTTAVPDAENLPISFHVSVSFCKTTR